MYCEIYLINYEKRTRLTLADSICDLRARKIKKTFFSQINNLLDWDKITKVIDNYYKKGRSASGSPSYEGLLLFKMCLLQSWYGLSDYEVEDRVNDSISFGYFCGLSIDQVSPDHSTLSHFRTAMTKSGAYEELFKEINRQLEAHQIIVKKGALVDASVINTPLKPKGKTKYKVTEDRVDLEEALDAADLPENIPLKADKGYQSEKNTKLLNQRKLKNHILKKAKKNKPLTFWEKKFNKLIGKTRYKVERTFGGIKCWFSGGEARYKGIAKMHTQNLMEAICYNLYRSPGIIASNCENK